MSVSNFITIDLDGGVLGDLPKRWTKGVPVEVTARGPFKWCLGYVDLGVIGPDGRLRIRFHRKSRRDHRKAGYFFGRDLRVLSLLEEMALVSQ